MIEEQTTSYVHLQTDIARRITFASAQNAVPIIRAIRIRNTTEAPLSKLCLTLKAQPRFCREKSWTVDRIGPEGEVSLSDRDLTLDLTFLAGLNEAEHGQLTLVLDGDGVHEEQTLPVELLARDQWGGLPEMAQILAAFVSPNEATTAKVLKEASRILECGGHQASLEGYQSGDPARTYMIVAAIWSAVTGMGLSYAEPPRSFENAGQKVRSPETIASQGLATCLDTTLLFAAALEGAGLNPAAVFRQGHVFAGVWLSDRTFPAITERDATELRKAIAAREFVVFETTLVTSRPPAGFEQAIENAQAQLTEEHEAEFEQAIDVTRARAAGIRPLASHRAQEPASAEPAAQAAVPLPKAPDFGRLPGELADAPPTTSQGRIERWQRKLLDLSLRNRLLNYTDSKQALPFVCPDVPALEDRLSDGGRLRVVSLTDENPIGDRDPALYRQQTGKDIHAEFAASAFERGQICIPLPGREMTARLTTLFRKAKSDLLEGGTNTLFLAVGFLRWKKSPEDKRSYRAPLLLLPVKLTRRSAQSDFHLAHHEDEVRVNATLLQFLERDFGLQIPALHGELPADQAGLDLPQIFQIVRGAVRDAHGFEVVEDIALSTFSFAKYLMWKDLVDRTDQLCNNRLVRHLIENPERPFVQGDGGFPQPRDIDRRAPADFLTPLPADSSQLVAVVAAEEGHDFVIIGPPGTGKSQTIANMIAHCLAKGKSVLFVAEKSAALDVVYRRLKAYGLGEACLELHSNKADRKSVITQLGTAWNRTHEDSADDWLKVTSQLCVRRDQLNAYAEALHAPGTHGYSVFDAIGLVVDREPAIRLSFARSDAHDGESFSSLRQIAERAGRTFGIVADCSGLSSIRQSDWSFGWQSELLESAGRLADESVSLITAGTALGDALHLASDAELTTARLDLLTRFAEVTARTAAEDYKASLDTEFDTYTLGLEKLETSIEAVHRQKTLLSARYSETEIARMPLEDMDRSWREAVSKTWPFSVLSKRRVRKFLQSYAESGKADPERELAPLREMQAGLASVKGSQLTTLPPFKGTGTDIAAFKTWLANAGELRSAISELSRLASDVAATGAAFAALLDHEGNTAPVVQVANGFMATKASFDSALARYVDVAGDTPEAMSISDLHHQMKELHAQKSRVADWTKWVQVSNEARGRGLDPLIEGLEAGVVEDALGEFLIAYFNWWLPLAIDAAPELRCFANWEQADRIETFRQLDAAAQRLSAAQVRRAIAHGLPARDGVPRKSQLGVLRHQLGLQRPSVSIRQLIGQMPTTFTKLAPCVLMSPLSVAQYLPAEHAQFDMVIFDEASQITTWDAVGAIARGRQSIIVGDPKQLPPTNFFGRAQEDDDDVELYEQDLPSILDEASAAGLPAHQLTWHYRSRDEALIAFSNHHYYGDRLVTFPSPRTTSKALVFHKIDGIYARGHGRTNEIEAKAIVEMAVRRMREWLAHPECERQTLGIITFNAPQQELILDLLDASRRDIPEIEWFFDDEREESTIVKNLENIQGDERDVMLFSITYGTDKAGKLSMSFGAINNDGGEKRLNVAVTRARSELHVFSSITADQIDLSRTGRTGVAHLKNFLDYAARGAVALPAFDHGSLGDPESPFEEAIADALRTRGWDVRTQIGVSGFRIDLGIVHPDRAGEYLAGIECDGATYHRSASARDRDRIRESVLRGLGWEIVRIWSTDWFMNPGEAGERVHQRLHEILDATREKETENDPTASTENDPVSATNQPASDEVTKDPLAPETPGTTQTSIGSDTKSAASTSSRDAERSRSPAYAHLAVGEDAAGTQKEAWTPDPECFFDEDYSATLRAIISDIVAQQAPIRDHLLARAVARAHGWQRTGRRIRERVEQCLGENEIHLEGDATFVWPPNGYVTIMPFRQGLDRSPRDISRSEIYGLIAANPLLKQSDDPVRDLARLMGINRLTEDARAYLKASLDSE